MGIYGKFLSCFSCVAYPPRQGHGPIFLNLFILDFNILLSIVIIKKETIK